MKINYRNTAIGLLEHIDPYSFTICEDDEHSSIEYKRRVGLSVVSEFPKVASFFKSKIQYISDPFYAAYLRCSPKLSSVIDNEDINESGTFISKSAPGETNTIFYHIIAEGKGAEFHLNCIIFFFTKKSKRDRPSLAIIIQKNNKGFKTYFSETATKHKVDAMSVIADVFTLILFMRYCDLETKIVNGKSKTTHIGTKYVNETNLKVEILDSTWFTTISRTEGFGVKGHFRLQPYGPGNSQRRLQWIADFQKHGYTKKAKILNQ